MASKKDKILESAQRFVLKGQIDKAIKDYQQVVVLDPKEIRHRQRLAELLVRDNRKDEAIVQYEDIGKHYAENSYYLKAIAVYKQIQRLVPENTTISLTLASLNNKQGLTGNALAEYGQVATQFEKEGNLKEAVKVLQEMLTIDGVPAATRLRYAELLYASGAVEQAYEEFKAYDELLRARDDSDAVDKLAVRMRELFPESREPAGDRLGSPATPAPEPARKDESSSLQVDLSGTGFSSTPYAAPSQSELTQDAGAPSAAPAVKETKPVQPLPWEDEIELDLDADVDLPAPPPVPDIELPLDFSLSLDFDEPDPFAVSSSEESSADSEPPPSTVEASPFGELPPLAASDTGAAELDLEEGGTLELDWPEEIDISLEDESGDGIVQTSELVMATDDDALAAEEATLAEEARLAEEVEAAEVAKEAEQLQARALRGWQEIFPETTNSPATASDLHELESHYDLGIAFKEMGRYGDAIKEFDVAASNERRRLDCLILQAICYREMGEAGKGEDLLQRGLSLEVLSDEERLSLRYELAYLFETEGKLDAALDIYHEVHRANPGFHDVAHRISRLAGEEPLDIIELELEEEEY